MRYHPGMLLFSSRFHAGLVSGAITLTFRLWDRARVRPGMRYRCHPIGVLEVDAVDRVTVGAITEEEARRAGLADRAELLGYMGERAAEPLAPDTPVFRIALHHAGDGDRVPGALDADLSDEAVREIAQRLARLDASSRAGPWTDQTLGLIEAHPRTAASRLARSVGRETAPFKADVVKLKKLGLTQSFEVGYEISPRGRAFLDRRGR
jgi:hypothetical protein